MAARKAIILLSGGLDSATCLALAKQQGFETLAMSFRYGQRHHSELVAAARVAAALGAHRHQTVEIDLRAFGGSALTADISVPKDRGESEMESGVPITYVPARNTIFLSFALALAEVEQAFDIFIGVNSVDYSGYPDCRPDFIKAFEAMANLATKASAVDGHKMTIHAPLMHLTKAEIIQSGVALGVDYSLTLSCYDPSEEGAACGHCDACQLRRKGFADAGITDPTRYRAG